MAMSQPSPGSLTGASSADATVMTMPTGSQVSGEGGVVHRNRLLDLMREWATQRELYTEIHEIDFAKNESCQVTEEKR